MEKRYPRNERPQQLNPEQPSGKNWQNDLDMKGLTGSKVVLLIQQAFPAGMGANLEQIWGKALQC